MTQGLLLGRGLRGTGLLAGLAALLAGYAVAGHPTAAAAAVDQAKAVHQAPGQDPIRPTEQGAVTYAARLGDRVEIEAFRTETRSVFANPDGTLTAREYAQPVRVVRQGRWVPVDATLAANPDGTYAPKAATLGLTLSGGGAGPLVSVDRAGRTLDLSWPGALPEPVVQGDRATYAEVLPDVDLVVNVGVSSFSHVLVVKSAAAAANPELAELEFGLKTNDLNVAESPDGGLTAVDASTGSPVLEAREPVMWDSGEPATAPAARKLVDPKPLAASEEPPASADRATLGLELAGDTLTLTPDREMLADPATTFPVYIDPIWQDTRNSGWTMVASGFAAEEYWKFSDTEGVGECPVSSGYCNGSGVKRIFYALPTPYSGKSILSAELAVTMTHTYNDSAKAVSAYHAKTGISSGTNWNNQPALGAKQDTKSPTATKGSCTPDNQNVRFNVKSIVTDAASKNWASTTFALKADSESDHTAWKRFCGNAILEVRYNRAPSTPVQSQLTNDPGGVCVYGANRPYVDVPPVLKAVLKDPDHSSAHAEKLKAQFKVYWPSEAPTKEVTYLTGEKNSGSTFSYSTTGLGIPQNVTIGWEVRAYDGTVYGNWSSYGDQTRCEFIYDATTPVAPDVDSSLYLPWDAADAKPACVESKPPTAEDPEPADVPLGSVGMYGKFVFDSSATDVVEYQYGFDTNPSPNNSLKPTADGGPVSIDWMPQEDGPVTVNVQAIDRAKRKSAIASCTFRVGNHRPVDWSLGEAAGSESAMDGGAEHPATPGAGAVFGTPGPGCQETGDTCQVDRAVGFSGGADAYLATGTAALVDTGRGFGVAAWVKLTDGAADRTVVSQDGTGQAGFSLGYDGTSKKWVLRVPMTDVRSLGEFTVSSSAAAAIGKWTHLAATYDPVKQVLRLYVNGGAATEAARRSAFTAYGVTQFGRRLENGRYQDNWKGAIADVAVFDRIVVPAEVQQLSSLRPLRLAYWPLNDASDNLSPQYNDAGQEMSLAGGASLYAPDYEADPFAEPPLVGSGHLVLDGVDDHARTASPVALPKGSFTVSVRVRLAGAQCTRTMAALSEAGVRTSDFVLRCNAQNQWEALLPTGDTDASPVTKVVDNQALPSNDSSGQHLALVYNAFRDSVTLYVNGQVAQTGTATHRGGFNGAGGVQVGRSLLAGVFGDYFAGAVDDVRIYSGVADAPTVQLLAVPTEQASL
ncbi:LamG-like jellyroll fold domain-containing protein [Actinoplanes sp. M2I2]|uniref:LamG-like jellyroll fold domain-containing protein n=1 Tax=Actinoplanes sp. M2I2 TaxID=1734444 RepID=UPI002020B2CE|nr:LamG-like jellyroll fold domain-containing protein [Actinoplanes sp. M2I2]